MSCVSSRTDMDDDVLDATSLAALDVVGTSIRLAAADGLLLRSQSWQVAHK